MSKPISRIKEDERGNWLDRVLISIKICEIVEYLHQIGMSITDIAPRNFLVSLPDHRLIMLDCDGIMPPGTNAPQVLGTPGYQAPEIMMGGWPTQQSDLHSLAVTIYRLLFLRHPLLGPLVHSPDPIQDDNLALGEKALFIEHPIDHSNRPASMAVQSKDFGDQLFRVVLKSFVDGLHSPKNRPSAGQWREALSNLAKELRSCTNPSCAGKYSLPKPENAGCYWCSAPYGIDRSPNSGAESLTETPFIDRSDTGTIETAKGRSRRKKKSSVIRILFLAANPTDLSRLRLDREIRSIDQALRQAEFRERFDIRQHWAVRVTDIQSHLLRHKPNIVHFSGHGDVSNEIKVEDDFGNSHALSVRALSRLFSVLKDSIRCVVLNACYSEEQAQAIADQIDCVIGMSTLIGDSAAISFATAFYQGLGYGRDVKTAFELGCVQIDLENLGEQNTPKLIAKRVDPAKIVFA